MKCIHQLSANQNKSKVFLFMSWRVTDDQENALLLTNFFNFECRIEVNSNGMVKSLPLFFSSAGNKAVKADRAIVVDYPACCNSILLCRKCRPAS